MAKDIQAQYLEPYTSGKDRWLGGKRGMIVPRGIAVNQYGNLPRNKLKQLKSRPNVFVGQVKFKKSGEVISGIWQRPTTGKRRAGDKGTKGKTTNSVGGVRTGLKLLIAFDDTTPAPKSFRFKERAAAYVATKARAEFATALAQAIRSARP